MLLPQTGHESYDSLEHQIKKGYIKIPQFQRDFVWTKDKSIRLLDSILKGFPIGTFILWKTKEELRVVRDIGGMELPIASKNDYKVYVLDGQQRLTSPYACINGLTIKRDERDEDFGECFINLGADESEQIVIGSKDTISEEQLIPFNLLLNGKISDYVNYKPYFQDKIQEYQAKIKGYNFSCVTLIDASIDTATEVFTRLNDSGKPLSVFEIMVAKTYDSKRNFDLSEKYDELLDTLGACGYDTIQDASVLQLVSILIKGDCKKKAILQLKKNEVIDIWDSAIKALYSSIDYFRDHYHIPVSGLLPYPALLIPFSYYFHRYKKNPNGEVKLFLDDFFWRASIGERYSSSLESKLAQDVKKIDEIVKKKKQPVYEWSVDISPESIQENGWFSVTRAYIKTLLCVLANKQPKSLYDGSSIRIGNDWLKRANSQNYHHFFPKSYLAKKKEEEFRVNHIANIVIIEEFVNKNEIGAKPPSK